MEVGSLDEAKKRILSRVSIETLIGEHVALTRRGGKLTGLCPFHAEKSPSFYVYDDHYHCFGCHAHGDAISFARQTRELSFIESLKYLAQKYGIDAPELEDNVKYQKRRNEQTVLIQIMVAAHENYVLELWSDRGKSARDYLESRGFSEDIIREYGFGLTPLEHFGTVRHLRQLQFRDDDIVKVGLASISNRTGGLYDFFRYRIMIPIRDASGRVIAFGGRTTVADPAKYKNSSSTILFDKSSVMFGLDRAKDAIREKGRAIIVEGYMDAMALWRDGIKECVASMGTALTMRQIKVLQSTSKCKDIIILFDGDKAGRNATLEAIDIALAVPNLRFKAVQLKDSFDPDTFIAEFGVSVLLDELQKSSDLIDVAMNSNLVGATIASVPTLVSEKFIPWLLHIKDPIKRSYLISMLASKTGIKKEILDLQVRSFEMTAAGPVNRKFESPSIPQTDSPEAQERAQKDLVLVMPTRPLTRIEEGFLGNLFHSHPGELELSAVQDCLKKQMDLEPLWDQFAKILIEILEQKKSPRDCLDAIVSNFTIDEQRVLEKILLTDPQLFETSDRPANLKILALEFRRVALQRSISSMKQQVSLVGATDHSLVPDLLRHIMTLNKALSDLNRPTS
ncbi:MAG: DNA primase [Proteobacteria bacterium]|nr:DNA primase [Pseudomonadota bacterium]